MPIMDGIATLPEIKKYARKQRSLCYHGGRQQYDHQTDGTRPTAIFPKQATAK